MEPAEENLKLCLRKNHWKLTIIHFTWGLFKYGQNCFEWNSSSFCNVNYNRWGKCCYGAKARKTPISLFHDDTSEILAFPYLFPESKIWIQCVYRDIPVSVAQYFNQRFLIFKQTIASEPDYVFLLRQSMYSIIWVHQ